MRVTIIFCVLLLIVFVRGLRPILPHVTEVRVDQEKNGVGFQVGRMETLGFHGDWYLLKAVDVIAKEVTTFIETGTHSASTLHYIARTYPSMSKVYSCEPVQEWYDISKHNMETVSPADLSWKSRVKIWKDTSQNMMKDILTTEPNIVNRDALFWFDAHGQKLFEWPLREEIEFVTNNWESDAFVGNDFDYVSAPVISDMDHDGHAEIVVGRVILNSDGTTRGVGTAGRGSFGMGFGLASEGALPAIADLDLDGYWELLVSPSEGPPQIWSNPCGAGSWLDIELWVVPYETSLYRRSQYSEEPLQGFASANQSWHMRSGSSSVPEHAAISGRTHDKSNLHSLEVTRLRVLYLERKRGVMNASRYRFSSQDCKCPRCLGF